VHDPRKCVALVMLEGKPLRSPPIMRGRLFAAHALSDDIRRDLIFDEGDTIAQLQLAFLHPLQTQQIGGRRLMECINRRVEIAVLLLQPCKLGQQLALIFVGHDVR
jgi:hypothetical protein